MHLQKAEWRIQVCMLFKQQMLWGKKGLLHLCSKGDNHDGVLAPDQCPKVLKQYK